jgi:pentatricopeptide repeat protein
MTLGFRNRRTSDGRYQNAVLVEGRCATVWMLLWKMLWERSVPENDRVASQNFDQADSLLAEDCRMREGLDLALEAGKLEFAESITLLPLMKLCCSSGDGGAVKRVWRAMVDCGLEGDMCCMPGWWCSCAVAG